MLRQFVKGGPIKACNVVVVQMDFVMPWTHTVYAWHVKTGVRKVVELVVWTETWKSLINFTPDDI